MMQYDDIAESYPTTRTYHECYMKDDAKSLSTETVSSIGSSFFDSSLRNDEDDIKESRVVSPSEKQNYVDITNNSPTTVLIDHDYSTPLDTAFVAESPPASPHRTLSTTNNLYIDNKEGVNDNHGTKSVNVSFGLGEDDWTSQGNQTEKTCTTHGTFYTGYTQTTGATKLHQNGVSAMLHRTLRRNNSYKDCIDISPVPTSIKTIRRPMSFDDGKYRKSVGAPPQKDDGKKICSKSKLKNDLSYTFFEDDDSLCNLISENVNHEAGNKSIGGFLGSFFQCC